MSFLIANHLFMLGVTYQYEADYEHETRTPDYGQYKPDFYLPDCGIYLEHWGIDRDGNTAPSVDKKKYHEGMEWKRGVHEKYGTRLDRDVLLRTYRRPFADGSG